MITIFKNIYSKEPHYITVEDALNRISSGRSESLVNEIRATIDKEKASNLKMNLPSVCFSGKFKKDRKDVDLIEHSGFIVLDFDNVKDLSDKHTEIINHDFVFACWVSPSGNGLKALIKIADGSKHREHFQALQDIFPEIDKSGANPSRVCFESHDPSLYHYPDARVFATIKKVDVIVQTKQLDDEYKIFKNLLTWLANRNDAFVTGERNNFVFKLASACCRFGLPEISTSNFIQSEFLVNTQFTKTESDRAIRSAYKANSSRSGSCVFENDRFIERTTKKEVEIDAAIFDNSIRPRDVIYGIDVKDKALEIYDKGYEFVKGINTAQFDHHFKPKKGEITLLTGIGNYGKSALKKWYQVMRVLMYDEKFATFSPEDNPPEEYYHDFVEILLGCDCTPFNPKRPSREIYERTYDWISNRIFYVYPKDVAPTPDYIKERFLELIIKEGVDGVDIDPFNRMANQYGKFQGRDKYLEFLLSDFSRFAQVNNVYFWIIAHPTKLSKGSDGNYPCPDVFDIADGAMWSNMMDNILVYHRPFAQTKPQDPTCEFYSKKIRRQKTVGKKGFFIFEMLFRTRRFFFEGGDPLQRLMNDKNIDFGLKQAKIDFVEDKWSPIKDGSGEQITF